MLNTQNHKTTWIKTVILLTACALALSTMAFAQSDWEEPDKSKQGLTPTTSAKPDAQQSEIDDIARGLKQLNEFIELDSKLSQITAQNPENCKDQPKKSESSDLFTPLEADKSIQQCGAKDHDREKDSPSYCAGEACNPEVGHCETYTVWCVPDDDILPGAEAECNRFSCRISLRTSTCERMNLEDGDVLCHKCFWRKLRERTPTSYSEVLNICTIAHEGQHLIDGPEMRECATEENASDRQASCLRAYYESLCKANPPVLSKLSCYALQAAACNADATKELQICRCESNEPTPSPCPECEERCNEIQISCSRDTPDGLRINRDAERELMRNQCEATARVYCR